MTASPGEKTTIHIRDHSYRWIVVEDVDLHAQSFETPSEMLAALIVHPSYRDHFASPQSETEYPIHGPYRIDAITPDSYQRLSGPEAVERLDVWLNQYGPLKDGEIEGDLAALRDELSSAEDCYYLGPAAKEAQHEWGFVVGGGSGFHEFILPAPHGVTMVVAADD